MTPVEIDWNCSRLDDCEGDPTVDECLFNLQGVVNVAGKRAGLVEAHYLYVHEPEADYAFLEFWDLDALACEIYEEIIAPSGETFRHPIPEFLDFTTGILCIHLIALRPEFRGIGIGRAVLRETIHTCADERTGVVLLDSRPLQHRRGGYDSYDHEVRDLPWNKPAEDHQRLTSHLQSWGMHPVPRTRFLAAAAEVIEPDRASTWAPAR
ncbi:MAG: hypothetical protein KDN05_20460 [Verrucomicrobiae bacterium]|nr:hypothetical protein [Verrucomicrobiae bacterium]